MKYSLIALFLCWYIGVALAQVPQSLNYQAVARNQQGNVLANKTVSVQIAILNNNNEVYKETHAATTNPFGLFTLQVGKGNVNAGLFGNIDWSTGSKLMKIGMDATGSGTYLDMGTSPLLTVPYAMIAAKALNVVDQSLAGLNDVDTVGKAQGYVLGWDGTKWKPLSGAAQQGWVMTNGDLSNVNPTGKIGIGVSTPQAKLHIEGNDKENIMAFKGNRFVSSRSNGTDYGVPTNGEGLYMTNETGNYKQAYYFTQGNALDTTPIFGITSKTGNNPWSPALNVSQQGMVGIGIAKPKAKLHIQNGGLLLQGYTGSVDFKGEGSTMMWIPNKSAFRAGYADGNCWDKDSIGINSTGIGYWTRAKGYCTLATGYQTTAAGYISTAMGSMTTASGRFSTAIGEQTTASEHSSTAMGSFTTASGRFSTAMGSFTTASADNATAMGGTTTASGRYSMAMGFNTRASGNYSTAMGGSNIAKSYCSTVIGLFNDTLEVDARPYDISNLNRIFQIGNGQSFARSNAMTVYHDGKVGLGTVNPQRNLSIAKNMNVDQLDLYDGTNELGLTFGSQSGEGIASKRTSGNGQYGLDFFTQGINRLSISNAGNTTVNGNLTVRDTLKATIDFSGKAFILNGSVGTTTLAGNGTRLMWIPAKAAFRAGFANNNSWNIDSIGLNSTAFGYGTKASNEYATAMGNFTTASGASAISMGAFTLASGTASMAMGVSTRASGDFSTALGSSTKATGIASTALGGTTTASGQTSFASGQSSTASGLSSTAMGNNTIASGDYSFAAGTNSKATGSSSIALGNNASASGVEAMAFGNSNNASGAYAMAIGINNRASGSNSFAFGIENAARSARAIVMGAYNDTTDTAIPSNYFDPTIRIFQIGNGDAFSGRTNAMTILKSGNVGLGVTNPQNTLSIKGSMNIDQTDANTGTLASGAIKFGNGSVEGIASKRTSGTGQFGLDFYTQNTNRMSISNTGTVTVANTLLVKGNKGVIRSNDATQQKKITTNVTVNASFAIGETKIFTFTFPEGFSASPDVYVGNIVSGSGNWAEALMVVNNITATGGTLYVFNAKGTTVTNNFIVKVIAIGAE